MKKTSPYPLDDFPIIVDRMNKSIGKIFNVVLQESEVSRFLIELTLRNTIAGIPPGNLDFLGSLEEKIAAIFVMIIAVRFAAEKGVTINDAINHTKQILRLEASLLSS